MAFIWSAEEVFDALVGGSLRPVVVASGVTQRPSAEEKLGAALLSQEELGPSLVDAARVLLVGDGLVDGGRAAVEGSWVVAASPDGDAGQRGRAQRAGLGDGRVVDRRADVEAFQLAPRLSVDGPLSDGHRRHDSDDHQQMNHSRHHDRTDTHTHTHTHTHTQSQSHTPLITLFTVWLRPVWIKTALTCEIKKTLKNLA